MPEPLDHHDLRAGDDIRVGDISDARAVAVGAGATAIYQGLTTEEVAALVVELKRIDRPVVWDGRIPYVGLNAFRESDAEFFFGRESLVDDLLSRVQAASFITIAGPSGSGKSSVARAGLFHALRQGRLERSDTWLLAPMQPEGDPIEQLAAAVARLAKSPAAGEHIRQHGLANPLALHQQLETLLSDDPRQRVVLLVDQFEESFTQTKDESKRAAFIDLLTTTARIEGGRTIILLALRSDFISHCARYPALRAEMNRQFRLVGAMAPRNLAQAIMRPALAVGAEIEPALVKQVIDDMKGEPGALPLMSFALRDLFEAEKSRPGETMDLTLAEYLQRGGLESALERHANAVFAELPSEEKDLARNIFVNLIEVQQGQADTRRTAKLAELTPAGADGAQVQRVVDRLAQEGTRLITTSSSAGNNDGAMAAPVTVTLAHESLIDAWPWLRKLVDENRELIDLKNQIHGDAQAWDQDKDPGFLYRGGRLVQVEEKLATLKPGLDVLSQRFIDASLAEQERLLAREADLRTQRRVGRIFRWATAVVLFLLLVAVFFAVQAMRNANVAADREAQALSARTTAEAAASTENEARSTAVSAQGTAQADATRANIAEAAAVAAQKNTELQRQIAALLAQSQALVNGRAPSNAAVARARLMAVAANQLDLQNGGLNRDLVSPWLLQLSRAHPRIYQPAATPRDHFGAITTMAWTADGSRLASAAGANDNTIIIWDTSAWVPTTRLDNQLDEVWSVAWHPEGRLLAAAGLGGTITIWDSDDTGEPLQRLLEHPTSVWAVAWSDDGSYLASADDNGTLIIWDPTTWQPIRMPGGHTARIWSLAWSTDGRWLAAGGADGSVIVWSTTNWAQVAALDEHRGQVKGIAWRPDGSQLATAAEDNLVFIWDTSEWELQQSLTDHNDYAWSVAWHPDGTHLATSSNDRSVIVWDAETWQPDIRLTGFTNTVPTIAWRADGNRLASGDLDSNMVIWDTSGWQPTAAIDFHQRWVTSLAWNVDGTQLASAGDDGRAIYLWNSANWQLLRTLTYGDTWSWITSLDWSHSGRYLAAADGEGVVTVWDTNDWQSLQTFSDHDGATAARVAWSADDSHLASADERGFIMVRETDGWQLRNQLDTRGGSIQDIAWNHTGRFLASASWDGDISVWDSSDWQLVKRLDLGRSVISLAWRGDGGQLAGGLWDGRAVIWNTETWRPLVTFTEHNNEVTSVGWNADQRFFSTGSEDGRVIIWDAATWQKLGVLENHTNGVRSVAWHPDSSRLASGATDNSVVISQLDLTQDRMCRLAGRNFTWEEWKNAFPDEPYRLVCPQWPAHPSVPPTARPRS